jgi:hypothetical protein
MNNKQLLKSFDGYESFIEKISLMKSCGMNEFMIKNEMDSFIEENFSKLTHEEKISITKKQNQ